MGSDGVKKRATILLTVAVLLLAIPLWGVAQEGTMEAVPEATAEAPVEPAAEASAAEAAPPAPTVDTGDTAWVLTCTALVLLMTAPGLALFYGGMVRKKNALGTIMHQAFMIFQMMFAVITPALITGAFAERMKFSALLLFVVLWSTLVYSPLAHWVWAVGGWVRNMGALDFAGGTVVHISSGVAALAAAIAIGRRRGYGSEAFTPHSLPLTVLGASLLWFGWFGFNAGSAVASGALATSAFVVTNTATASAALTWMFVEWAYRGKPTVLGAASGAVAGLVAITPAAGFVGPISSIWIGIGAGVLCYFACIFKSKLGYDDALDVVGVHGIGGTWGALATGLFASKAINSAGADGLFFGNPGQLIIQIKAVLITWIFVFIASFIILKVVDAIVGLRISDEEEKMGLDLGQHHESAYN